MISVFGCLVMKIKNTQTHKIKQKPVEYDVHLKYICPECHSEHWLSLLEASTANFKVVCHCGTIFKVKRILGMKLRYAKSKISKPEKPEQPIKQKTGVDIKNNNIAKQAVDIIQNYGFTRQEAIDLVVKCYDTDRVYSVSDLVKETLQSAR